MDFYVFLLEMSAALDICFSVCHLESVLLIAIIKSDYFKNSSDNFLMKEKAAEDNFPKNV